MKITDNRLAPEDKALLAGLVGSELESFRCDEFMAARPCATGVVAVRAGGRTFALRADLVVGEPYGEPDDVAQLSFREEEPGSIRPVAIGARQVVHEVGRRISGVMLYEDTIERLAGGEVVSRYVSTPAVVFRLEGTELVFENQGWLDETIDIHRGPGASREVRAPEDPIEDDDPEEFRASREVVSLGGR